ncbi:MAG: hypothetical protein JXR48_15925 [Candidatus Delongbacteria bacterium]|nr:hypothetical protein [Candidatus Delongbacteria bacterium]MBN2836446.1 hypothetical protein [Candidatus Delongbacteria bacterium]
MNKNLLAIIISVLAFAAILYINKRENIEFLRNSNIDKFGTEKISTVLESLFPDGEWYESNNGYITFRTSLDEGKILILKFTASFEMNQVEFVEAFWAYSKEYVQKALVILDENGDKIQNKSKVYEYITSKHVLNDSELKLQLAQ